MTGKIFCCAVDHQIDAVIERPLVKRGGKRGIDDGDDLVLVADLFEFDHVKHVQIRIGRRFRKNKPRVLFDGSIHHIIISERHDGAFNAESFQIRPAEFQCFPVTIVGNHDMIPGLHQRQNGGGDGHHARRKHQRFLGAVEFRQASLRHLLGRIPVSSVLVTFFVILGVGFNFLAVLKGIGGGLNNGRGDGIGIARPVLSCMD